MASINKVILVGNLGKDPDIRYTASGAAVVNISVATSESWQDKQSGEKREKTEWHRVVFFGKVAEVAGEYLKKGSQVYIEGQIRTRKWQDQSGQDKYSTEIVVDGFNGVMQMLGGRGRDAGGQSDSFRNQRPESSAPVPAQPQAPKAEEDFQDDDIPF